MDHMEPDHAAMIEAVLVRWPDLRLVVNAKNPAHAENVLSHGQRRH